PQQTGAPKGARRAAAPEAADFTVVEGTPARPPAATFAEPDLPKAILSAPTREGVTEPFPIQGATLPDSIASGDVPGRGRTGSGNTVAFGLPLLACTAGPPDTGRYLP
ncbi:hypothetical protein VM98_37425, partial [Streptomyces rubellomurinus subsp. indigoferus]